MLFNSVYQNYSDMGEAYADCFGSKIQSVVAQSPAADQQHAATMYNVQRQKQLGESLSLTMTTLCRNIFTFGLLY